MSQAPLHYRPAHQLADDLRSGKLTSVELTQSLLHRINSHNPHINAFTYVDGKSALEAAADADARLKAGVEPGPLHGLPLTVKDTWEVAGMPCTAGAPKLKRHRPKQSAAVVQRLQDAGAIILGKSNVPLYASDIQSYNRLFGVTNNPHNKNHTPGGSSGGAAAALAAGMTPLEIGSDLAGSIRTPSHFCGVFGHKPSRGLISMRGHIPGPPGALSEPDLVTGGPMARTSDDLELLLDVLAGPNSQEARSWKLEMEQSSHASLSQVRVGHWFSDPACPIDKELAAGYQNLTDQIARSGVSISPARHPLLDLERILPVYFCLLGGLMGGSLKPAQKRQMLVASHLDPILSRVTSMTVGSGHYGRGVNLSYGEWLMWNEKREQMRAQVETLFNEYDVLLTPVTPTTAIPHDHSQPVFRRKIQVSGKPRPYMDQFCWIALATLLGLPATSVPIGRTANGLPYNVQVIGAPGKDLTTIGFARLLEQQGLAGFQVPAGF
ncbi:amidase [Marinobacter zhejiangensis]|uniref:Amidase n=1 Tax=Marinobacter zhejiangensis TaxID=488535 RepID=A0A1I4NM98_9GAMM|nr:amidase [Marinobacter zhejiangensis]SFM16596.1 amidase [Marinobacter zhejiangensis]